MRLSTVSFAALTACIALCAGSPGDVAAQDTIKIKFKLFETNKPHSKEVLQPRKLANLTLRDQRTKLPSVPVSIDVETLSDGFSQVTVDKDVLIERLRIDVVGARYSPADITKLVTKADINLYPGVSDSLDEFSFAAYTGQLNSYRAMLTELTLALPDRKDDIRKEFGSAYRAQLENLYNAATSDRKRLLTNDPTEIAAAEKLAKEVLQLYGLLPDDPPSASPSSPILICPPPVIYPIYPCYPMFPGGVVVHGWPR